MSRVYIATTSPKKVITDYQKLLQKAQYLKGLKKGLPIVLKLNQAGERFYPASSTPPWQLEGVIKTLISDGIKPKDIIAIEDSSSQSLKISINNKWSSILKKYGVKLHHLSQEKYVDVKISSELSVLGNKIKLPKIIVGKNLITLSTLGMSARTTINGAVKNYFGILDSKKDYNFRVLNQILIDLLVIQREVHPGSFSVMDATIVGKEAYLPSGDWEIKNYILGSVDPVALDSTAVKMMGFNPLKTDYLSLAEDQGLGKASPKKIKVVGLDISKINWHFRRRDNFASRSIRLMSRSPFWIEKLLLRSPIIRGSVIQKLYRDYYWWNLVGKGKVGEFLKTDWGHFFQSF
ncbi:MAG: DUF362 domain-containing protein [Candidatus Daviesbacteria bacterium]|nr:DUF362 domain-containing protein [Candidatus Daviesbacteria bacterium]